MNALRRMSVHSKTLIAFVALTLLSIAAISWIGYRNARISLRTAVVGQLQGMQRTKANVVRTMLTATKNQVLAFSKTSAITDGSENLLAAYRSIRPQDVTPEMKQAVRRFYDEEFTPLLVQKMGISPVAGGFYPKSDAGWYVQYHYIAAAPRPYGSAPELVMTDADESAYGRVLRGGLHQAYVRRGRLLGIEQMLIVERERLEVIYAYAPSTILGTSLLDGPYAASNLAASARELRSSHDEDDYRVVDTEAHWPALGAAKGYVATPVFDGPRYDAILFVRFPIEPIEAALNGNRQWREEGLGRTGEVYIVGPDMALRTNSRFFLEDKQAFLASLTSSSRQTARTLERVRQMDSTLLVLPVKNESTLSAHRGETGVREVEDYRGERVLSAYGPLDLDSLRWAVLAEMDVAEVEEPLRRYARSVLAAGAGLALLSSVLALLLANVLTRPITNLVRAARRVSAGETNVAVKVAPEGDYRELGEAFNDMVQSLLASREELDRQVKQNEHLLLSLLPASGAAQLRDGNPEARQAFADVTVAYVSLLGLEDSSHDGDTGSMELLSEIVAACDEAAEAHGVERVRTIGSSYLAACGLSVERPDHTARMVEFAREVLRIVKRFNTERGTQVVAEIGINTGPVVGGLVGRRKFIYDLWGDTVKIARGIESDGRASITVTRAVHDRVRDVVAFEPCRTVEVRGLGPVEVFEVAEGVPA